MKRWTPEAVLLIAASRPFTVDRYAWKDGVLRKLLRRMVSRGRLVFLGCQQNLLVYGLPEKPA